MKIVTKEIMESRLSSECIICLIQKCNGIPESVLQLSNPLIFSKFRQSSLYLLCCHYRYYPLSFHKNLDIFPIECHEKLFLLIRRPYFLIPNRLYHSLSSSRQLIKLHVLCCHSHFLLQNQTPKVNFSIEFQLRNLNLIYTYKIVKCVQFSVVFEYDKHYVYKK